MAQKAYSWLEPTNQSEYLELEGPRASTPIQRGILCSRMIRSLVEFTISKKAKPELRLLDVGKAGPYATSVGGLELNEATLATEFGGEQCISIRGIPVGQKFDAFCEFDPEYGEGIVVPRLKTFTTARGDLELSFNIWSIIVRPGRVSRDRSKDALCFVDHVHRAPLQPVSHFSDNENDDNVEEAECMACGKDVRFQEDDSEASMYRSCMDRGYGDTRWMASSYILCTDCYRGCDVCEWSLCPACYHEHKSCSKCGAACGRKREDDDFSDSGICKCRRYSWHNRRRPMWRWDESDEVEESVSESDNESITCTSGGSAAGRVLTLT